jgi:hypothetical protein
MRRNGAWRMPMQTGIGQAKQLLDGVLHPCVAAQQHTTDSRQESSIPMDATPL